MTSEIKPFSYNGNPQLIIPAKRSEFTVLQEWILSIATQLDVPERLKKQLLICCDEIFTNIASYAYSDDNGSVTIGVELITSPKSLRIIFSDSGIAFNPLEISEPDTNSALSERKIGGLGMFMVKKMMDSVEYSRQDGKNILTLTKSLENCNK